MGMRKIYWHINLQAQLYYLNAFKHNHDHHSFISQHI